MHFSRYILFVLKETNDQEQSSICSVCNEGFPSKECMEEHMITCCNKKKQDSKWKKFIRRTIFGPSSENNRTNTGPSMIDIKTHQKAPCFGRFCWSVKKETRFKHLLSFEWLPLRLFFLWETYNYIDHYLIVEFTLQSQFWSSVLTNQGHVIIYINSTSERALHYVLLNVSFNFRSISPTQRFWW